MNRSSKVRIKLWTEVSKPDDLTYSLLFLCDTEKIDIFNTSGNIKFTNGWFLSDDEYFYHC